jgi:hypothetical protein
MFNRVYAGRIGERGLRCCKSCLKSQDGKSEAEHVKSPDRQFVEINLAGPLRRLHETLHSIDV